MSQIPDAFQGHDLTGWTYTRGYASNQAFDHVSRLAADGSVVTVYGDLSWIIVACTGQQIEADDPEIKTPSNLDLVVQKHCGGWAPAPIGCSDDPGWQPDLLALLKQKCEELGGVRKLAQAMGVSPTYACQALLGNVKIGAKIRAYLGYESVTILRPLPQPPQEGQG